ncbi:MAG: hypothetical protein KIT31_19320 [Deltaproteobacteria bacterium]|nr:hypothetical protein [Deltaproteobacteria bacterium]
MGGPSDVSALPVFVARATETPRVNSIALRFEVAFPTEVVMLPSLSRAWRLGLLLLLAVGYVAWHGQEKAVYASTASDDDDGGGGGDDDDDGGAKSGGDDDDDDGADKEQPAVTAGGLYTMKTFPIRELDRPLTITRQIGQLRLGLGTDVSAGTAFESVGVSLEGIYGLQDNFMLLGGFTSAYNFDQFAVYGGFEGALAYDLIDFRAALRVSRSLGVDSMGVPTAGAISGGIDIGFPFRYVAKPEIAIVALNTLMSIDFDSKPDLRPSIGIATNPIPPVSLVVFATLVIPDFNTDADNLQIPATARIQFSPNQKFDIGGEFTFLNLKPPSGNFIDNRFLTFYIQSRFGK